MGPQGNNSQYDSAEEEKRMCGLQPCKQEVVWWGLLQKQSLQKFNFQLPHRRRCPLPPDRVRSRGVRIKSVALLDKAALSMG